MTGALNFYSDLLPSALLCFFQLTFLVLLIVCLHSIRRIIGQTSYYMIVGFILVFAQIINAADLRFIPDIMGMELSISSALLLTPFMAALLITYTLDGPIAAQRLTVAAIILSGSFYLLNTISIAQTQWFGFAIDPAYQHFLQDFLQKIRLNTTASLAAIVADLLVLPVIYQIFKNRNYGTFISVVISCLLTQVVDTYVYTLISNYQSSEFWLQMNQLFVSRVFIMLWLAIIITIYLKLNNYDQKETERNPMDFLRAVISSYSYSNLMSHHAQDWEGRFALFVENSPDLILLCNDKGYPSDANKLLLKKKGMLLSELQKKHVTEFCVTEKTEDGSLDALIEKQLSFEEVWEKTSAMKRQRNFTFEWIFHDYKDRPLVVEFIASILYSGKVKMLLLTGRETTAKHQLTHQHSTLLEQVSHLQRLESVGRLAGGVAHDFNNLLHSIQGSLDSIPNHPGKDEQKHIINNINVAINRASDLTSQLLSFAKKGNFELKKIELGQTMQSAWELFRPTSTKTIKSKLIIFPSPLYIRGDRTQIEQMMLNLLINARDALEHTDNAKITLRSEPASEKLPGWEHAASELSAKNYSCLRIKDNGSGIPPEIVKKVFEPFFTTKEVGKGTGMGLSMVYGTASSHNGWVHLESQVDKGTEFFIFLPNFDAPSASNITRYDMDINENVQTLH